MLYTLEQGPVEQTILKQCQREGLPLPKRIQNAPSLELGLELYYGAFFDLHSCRQVGMEEGPISWITINDYCDRIEVQGDQRADMHHHVREMDNAYLEWVRANRKKKS